MKTLAILSIWLALPLAAQTTPKETPKCMVLDPDNNKPCLVPLPPDPAPEPKPAPTPKPAPPKDGKQ